MEFDLTSGIVLAKNLNGQSEPERSIGIRP